MSLYDLDVMKAHSRSEFLSLLKESITALSNCKENEETEIEFLYDNITRGFLVVDEMNDPLLKKVLRLDLQRYKENKLIKKLIVEVEI